MLSNDIFNKINAIIDEKKSQEQLFDGFIGTEVGFAKQFKVSRPTIRKAVDVLVKQNKIKRIQGKGLQISNENDRVNPESKITKNYLILITYLQYSDGYFSEISRGIVNFLNECNFNYKVFHFNDDKIRLDEMKKIDLTIYDGVFITAYETEYDFQLLELFKKNNIRIILVDNQLDSSQYNCVKINDYKAGYLLGEYLVSCNHKNIAFYRYGLPAQSCNDRIRGIRAALSKASLTLAEDDIFVYETELSRDELLDDILSSDKNYSAIVFFDDRSAIYGMNQLKNKGINVPENISVAGFGGYVTNEFVDLPITTINFHGHEIGFVAANLMINSICERGNDTVHILTDVELIITDSVKNSQE